MRTFDGRPMCQLKHCQTEAICKLPSPTFTWFSAATFRNLSTQEVIDAFGLAWDFWKKIIAISPTQTRTQNGEKVFLESGHIDGSNGILAWAELPCPDRATLRCRFDSSDPYTITAGGVGLDLVRVAAHEFGHLLGIGHIGPGNLMAPNYSGSIRVPQAGDIAEALARYQPASPDPVPPPNPTPPDGCADEICDLLTLILREIRVISAKLPEPPTTQRRSY